MIKLIVIIRLIHDSNRFFVSLSSIKFCSQEEIESLRERMSAQTLLVVVGSSDDALRVKRLNRSMEGVSQTMIDSMILVC